MKFWEKNTIHALELKKKKVGKNKNKKGFILEDSKFLNGEVVLEHVSNSEPAIYLFFT